MAYHTEAVRARNCAEEAEVLAGTVQTGMAAARADEEADMEEFPSVCVRNLSIFRPDRLPELCP